MNLLTQHREIRARLGGDWVAGLSLLIIFLAAVIIFRGLGFEQWRAQTPRDSLTSADGPDSGTPSTQGLASPPPVTAGVSKAKPNTAAGLWPEPLSVSAVDLLGVSIELRELRGGTGADGPIRNMEFFIREGILPRRLFADTSQIVAHYWPLYHNNVGYGATTVRLLYQVITQDSNSDGLLNGQDRQSLAVSLPDGSGFRVIDGDVGEVVDMVYLSDRGELQMEFLQDGRREKRVYVLASDG